MLIAKNSRENTVLKFIQRKMTAIAFLVENPLNTKLRQTFNLFPTIMMKKFHKLQNLTYQIKKVGHIFLHLLGYSVKENK